MNNGNTTHNLADSNMLIDLTIKNWTARKKDKKVTKETHARYGTNEKAGNFNKNLLPFEAPSFTELQSAMNELGEFHRHNTLPWSDEGGLRILPSINYMPYMEGYRSRKAKIEELATVFLEEFPKLVARAEKELDKRDQGGKNMFNSADYPTVAELRARIKVSVNTWPLPTSDDFRVDLPAGEVRMIKEQIEQQQAAVIGRTTTELAERIKETVGHVHEILGAKDKKRVYQSLFDNVKQMAELLPRLNIDNNPQIAALGKEALEYIGTLDKDFVAKSPKLRKATAKKAAEIEQSADDIVKAMSAFMA